MRLFARVASATAVGIGALVLVGWALDVTALKSVSPGLVTMKANTALSFLLSGGSLWLLAERTEHATEWSRRAGQAAALIVIAVAALTLSEYLFGWELGIDQLLFKETIGAVGTSHSGRMAPHTALSFIFIGCALLLLDVETRQSQRSAQVLALAALVVSTVAVVGYAQHVASLYRIGSYTGMALHTSLTFFALSLGILCARPHRGLVRVFLTDGPGGMTARRLFPAAIATILVLGWLRIEGERAGLYGTETGVALMVTATVFVTGLLVYWTAVQLGRSDAVRRRAEEAVLESERRLSQLLEALPVGVFVLDAGGVPHYANHRAQEILGKGIVQGTAAGDLPEAYQAYVPGTDELYPGDRQPIVFALRGEKAHVDAMEIRRPDRSVPIEVWAAPVLDSQGRVTHAVAAFSDITERERARQEIERLNAELSRNLTELKAINQELEAFSYSVSHDLRAPLRGIDGFSQALLEDCAPQLDDRGKDYLHRIRAATQRLAELIDDLLGLARVARAELRREQLDLTGLARSVVAELHQHEPQRSVEFVCAEGAVAHGDRRLLRVVLENLLGNAWKFTLKRPHARIEFGATENGGRPEYFVRDNGAGFDMAYVNKLFGAFQRLHGTTEFPGTGIGLATVQRIIHRHGGQVWAEGAVDQGATFYFTL